MPSLITFENLEGILLVISPSCYLPCTLTLATAIFVEGSSTTCMLLAYLLQCRQVFIRPFPSSSFLLHLLLHIRITIEDSVVSSCQSVITYSVLVLRVHPFPKLISSRSLVRRLEMSSSTALLPKKKVITYVLLSGFPIKADRVQPIYLCTCHSP
jgi:hypothetical protein